MLQMAGTNALDPDEMTGAERSEKVSNLLAIGILRREARLRDQREFSEKSLDLLARLCPHVPDDGTRDRREAWRRE